MSLSVRRVKRVATLRVASALAACAALVALGAILVRSGRDNSKWGVPPISDRQMVQGLTSSTYQSGRLQTRISAASIAIARPRVLGPFRLGFLRTVTANEVSIETVEEDDRLNGFEPVSSGPVDFLEGLAHMSPRWSGGHFASAEVSGLRFVRRRGDRVILAVEAERCSTSLHAAALVCTNGTVRDELGSRSFREARYDGAAWQTVEAEPISAPRRQ